MTCWPTRSRRLDRRPWLVAVVAVLALLLLAGPPAAAATLPEASSSPASPHTPSPSSSPPVPSGEPFARYSVQVVWSGGESCSTGHCNGSDEMTPWPEGWAASRPGYGGGEWNGGVKAFANPLPRDTRVLWVEINLHGRFQCESNDTQNMITVYLNNYAATRMEFRPTEAGCAGCLACGYHAKATTSFYDNGIPDYYYGTRATNLVSIRVDSGIVVLNAADIHLYTKVADNNDTTIDLTEWQFIFILVAAFVGIVILMSIICFGILLFLKWRERRRRNFYTTIGEGDTIQRTGNNDRRHNVIINLSQSGELLTSGENASLLSRAHGNLGNMIKAKEARGDITEHEGSWKKGSGSHDWMKQIQVSEIQIIGRIGRGSYGDVFKGVWRGTVVAVKKLPVYFVELREDESAAFLENFQREAEIMKSLHHPNILQLLSTYMEPPDLCLVIEYMPRGSLYNILHDQTVQLSWPIIRKILLGAAKGMAYLHGCEPVVVHRDLKSHNLLIDENWHCKVCDFGLSKFLTDRPATSKMTSCGTPSWTAPEVLRNEAYSERADIFGFGIIVWECLTREDPHAGMPPFQVVLEVGTKHLRPEIPKNAPLALRDLIERCWTEDPAQRPSFQEIVAIISEIEVQMLYPADGDIDKREDSRIRRRADLRPPSDDSAPNWWDEEVGGPVVQSPTVEPRHRNGCELGRPSL